ncbi:MAG TPA: diadenylate cyclase [Phycisphaerales bacterium]|nr:diadenylate cyclase [Phycisphaerales bacterium]HMP37678.1 diadenylate cyclase [Phycisphaerales bacterium]
MLRSITEFLAPFNLIEVAFELLVIWIVVWFVYRFIESSRGAGVLRGMILLILIVTVAIKFFGEAFGTIERLSLIYDNLVSILAILLIVVFQPELRQGMVRLGEVFSRTASAASVIDEVDRAVDFLSKNQFGAIIVFERTIALRSIVEGGVALDARLSARLLQSIFYPNNPLHDLAVVIRGDRILAANVQLPLADVGVVDAELGSRHRAAVGVTMETDAIALVVSEEKGTIRIADRGRLSPAIAREQFRAELQRRLLEPVPESAAPRPLAGEPRPAEAA